MDSPCFSPGRKRPRHSHDLPSSQDSEAYVHVELLPRYTGRTFYVNRMKGEGREDHNLAFSDLLDPPERATRVFVSAMGISREWLEEQLASCPRAQVAVLHHHQAMSQEDLEALRGRGWKLVEGTGPRGGKCVMHAKLCLVRFGEELLRVAVTSSNLMAQWEHSREVVWVQDFKIYPEENHATPHNPAPKFEMALRTFLKGCGVDERLLNGLIGKATAPTRVDFTSAQAALMPSCKRRGGNKGDGGFDGKHHGHRRFGEILSEYRWPARARDAPVVCMQGSLGFLSREWLRGLRESLTGKWRHLDPSGGRGYKPSEEEENTCPPIQVVHPTNATVWRATQQFINAACFQHKVYVRPEFDRDVMYDYTANDQITGEAWKKFIPQNHAKVIIRTVPSDFELLPDEAGLPEEQQPLRGWVYVGSHNLSRAAWGASKTQPSNIELGVLLVTRDQAEVEEWRSRLPALTPAQGAVKYSDSVVHLPKSFLDPDKEELGLDMEEGPWSFGFSVIKRDRAGKTFVDEAYTNAREAYMRKHPELDFDTREDEDRLVMPEKLQQLSQVPEEEEEEKQEEQEPLEGVPAPCEVVSEAREEVVTDSSKEVEVIEIVSDVKSLERCDAGQSARRLIVLRTVSGRPTGSRLHTSR